MTWCSEDSATPRFVLASSAIRCRFVDRFVRLKVLSRVSRQRFSPHGTPLPSIGSRRVRFPDVSGRIEVLRLPVTHPRSLICFASGVHAALLGSCLAACAPKRSEGAFWAGVNVTGDPIAGLLSRGRERDLPGSQAIHPMPLPRSTTPAESTIPRLFVGFVDATPAQTTAKASASWLYRGYRGASAPVAYASRMVLPPSMQGSLPAGWLAFTGRELNPLDRDEGFQITSSSSLPGLFLAQRPKTCTGADILAAGLAHAQRRRSPK